MRDPTHQGGYRAAYFWCACHDCTVDDEVFVSPYHQKTIVEDANFGSGWHGYANGQPHFFTNRVNVESSWLL